MQTKQSSDAQVVMIEQDTYNDKNLAVRKSPASRRHTSDINQGVTSQAQALPLANIEVKKRPMMEQVNSTAKNDDLIWETVQK